MKTLLARDYEALTKNILAKNAQDEAALADLITKTAMGMELAPEQIRTLVRGVNTMAHLAAMDKKVDGDKYVDFEPVDPDAVIKNIYTGPEKTQERTAEDRVSDFLGNVGEADTPLALDTDQPEGTKEAALDSILRSEGISCNPAYSWDVPTPPDADNRRQRRSVATLKKVALELRDRKLRYSIEYRDNLEKLAHTFRKVGGPDIDAFEKDAVALHGDFGTGVAGQIRVLAHKSRTKIASEDIPENYIVAETPELEILEAMAKTAQDYAECEAGLKKLDAALTQAS